MRGARLRSPEGHRAPAGDGEDVSGDSAFPRTAGPWQCETRCSSPRGQQVTGTWGREGLYPMGGSWGHPGARRGWGVLLYLLRLPRGGMEMGVWARHCGGMQEMGGM